MGKYPKTAMALGPLFQTIIFSERLTSTIEWMTVTATPSQRPTAFSLKQINDAPSLTGEKAELDSGKINRVVDASNHLISCLASEFHDIEGDPYSYQSTISRPKMARSNKTIFLSNLVLDTQGSMIHWNNDTCPMKSRTATSQREHACISIRRNPVVQQYPDIDRRDKLVHSIK